MSGTAHTQLAVLTDMLFKAEQSKMHHILVQEAALRRDLVQLDASRLANLALPDAHLRAVRQIGADVQWQAWLGRARADLNRQLALCLVQKERMMKALRRAHGRKLAADQITAADQQSQARLRDKRENDNQDMFSMLKEIQRVRGAG